MSLPVKGETSSEGEHIRPKALCASHGYCLTTLGKPGVVGGHVEEEVEGFSPLCDSAEQLLAST